MKELALAVSETEERYPKRLVAKAFDIARSSLYYKLKQPEIDKGVYDQILEIYKKDDTLGCRKLAVLLNTSKNRIFRVMLKYGIGPRRKRPSYKYPGRADDVIGNKLLKEDYENHEVLFSDIFQFRLADGSWVYCSFVMRKKTRQILAFSYGYSMPAELVSQSIKRIDLVDDLTDTEVIFHSDQGKQYGAKVTIDACIENRWERSMSRAGTPTDNGYAERFVGTFKLAVVERYKYRNVAEFEEFATEWLNFYNGVRPHQSLKQISPNSFAEKNGIKKIPYLYLNFV